MYYAPSVRTRLISVGVIVMMLLLAAPPFAARQQPAAGLDSLFTAFWRAPDPQAAGEAARQVLAVTQEFSSLYARLKAGRPYTFGRVDDLTTPATSFAPAATMSKARRDGSGLWHPYLVMVPAGYDPTKRYPVRFFLQGDTSQPASSAESGAGWPNYDVFARDDAIVVFPGAWNGFAWWSGIQADHMAAVLDDLKRTYNVDENRVFLLGSSDGGTAIYYHALVNATPWAGFLPFNADPSVLAEPQAGVDAQLHAANIALRPFFVVHGGRDQIFPAAAVLPWLRLFENAGGRIDVDVKREYGHETAWWNEEVAALDRFIGDHPRDPLPDRIVWETAQSGRFNRASWVIVDEVGGAGAEAATVGPNEVVPGPAGIGVGIWREDPAGIRVAMIQPASPAALAGLHDGDVITRIKESRIATFDAIETALAAGAGTDVPLSVVRNGTRAELLLSVPPAVQPALLQAFPHPRRPGRVEVERRDNTVELRTRGVQRVTLLLSPDRFDFSRPIKVIANGTVALDGMLAPSGAVLMKWAARDNDRTMLFAQELTLRLQ